ncbi:hypothetical protein EUGRSUZ_F02664 [Eucalyptus grandis]|uniref:shikimate kinase n=3 Tax=Eucalyptus grandis TaxID=71139 RepID=A0A059BU04_EUCGR|nr:hypothetical protein EUGRSUZ_F02664 [Eucalyptus grandis]KAK3426146.1 hypothetical protein EUGRSUZ_F02664 [Eucalyptus grandis]
MEAAACGPALQFPPPVRLKGNGGRQRDRLPSPRRSNLRLVTVRDSRRKPEFLRQRKPPVGLLQSRECSQVVPALEAGCLRASSNGNWLLKTKAQEVSSCLDGRSIFLVGMMGSGKTTVGKILSEALGYTFVDSDKYVEQAIGQDSVTQIFKQRGECIFRDYESDALRKLSFTPQQVVATGGGAVVRPINWKYIKQGVSVFLDVPLDALARRIAAVGTASRPLLHFESGDPYTQAFVGLFTLSKKRAESYASADVKVSILDLAANLGVEDVLDVTPKAIAIEVLVQIEKFLQGNDVSRRMFP